MHHHVRPLHPRLHFFPWRPNLLMIILMKTYTPFTWTSWPTSLTSRSCAFSLFDQPNRCPLWKAAASRLLRHLSDASEGRRIDNVALWFWRRFLSTYLSGSTKGSPFTKNSYEPSLTHWRKHLFRRAINARCRLESLRPRTFALSQTALACSQPFQYMGRNQSLQRRPQLAEQQLLMPNPSRRADFLPPPDEIPAMRLLL